MPSELEQVRLPGAVERFVPEVFTLGVPEQLDPESPANAALPARTMSSSARSVSSMGVTGSHLWIWYRSM